MYEASMSAQWTKITGKSTGVSWKKLVGKWGRATRVRTSRFDDLTDEAIERVAARDEIKTSTVIYTGVRSLKVIRDEITTIKQERRGVKTRTTGDSGQR